MTDVYSIGEMLIDFIPGSEPASYIRKPGELRQMRQSRSQRTVFQPVCAARWATTISDVS